MRNSAVSTSPFWKVFLLVAALWLAGLLPGPASDIRVVHAQNDFSHLYIEPGTTVLRDPKTGGQIQGKVVIDRRTGDVWGFPTSSSAPFPVSLLSQATPVSKPMYLGRFDFASMRAE